MAWRCETVCQYQPPPASAPTTSTAAPVRISVRGVGQLRFSMSSSYAKSPAILSSTGAAALPALRGATHEVPAMGTALEVHPAKDQADAGHQPHTQHQRDVHAARASGELDEDVAVVDGHREARHFHRRVVGVGAGRDVPAPRVPWAGDEPALEIAFAERSAAMDARVVDRVEGAIDVEERQVPALGRDDAPFADRHVLDGGQPDTPISHCRAYRSARELHAIGNNRGDDRSPCPWPA